jgi:acyl carrier protein
VACGAGLCGQQLTIVDPTTNHRLDDDQVGEIWIAGPSVARGYWNRPHDTAHVFEARIAGDDAQSADDHDDVQSAAGTNWLRSGDLGFISDGELYITGRLKEVIIIRGRNHYPQDIERTMSATNDALTPNAGAAFAVEADEQERLVVVHEIERNSRHENFSKVLRDIRTAVVREHEVEVQAIVLIRPVSLPRTTSGKVQRSLCRAKYLRGELKVVAEWSLTDKVTGMSSGATRDLSNGHAGNGNGQYGGNGQYAAPLLENGHAAPIAATPSPAQLPEGITAAAQGRLTAAEIDRLAERIEARMLTWLVDQTGVSPDDVDRQRPLADYGLDSLAAVELSHELEHWLHIRIPAIAAWNYPTPQLLARWLAEQAAGDEEPAAEATPATSNGEVTDFERLLEEIEGLDDGDVKAALEKRGGKP